MTEGRRSFARNVLTVMTGRTAATVVNFALTPIVARLFAPEHWGVAVVFLAFAATVGPLSCLRYEKAIQVARDNIEANHLVILCTGLTLVATVLVLLLAAVVQVSGWAPDAIARMGAWIWLLPLGVFLQGQSFVLGSWLTRAKRFVSQATGSVLESFSNNALRIALGSAFGSSVSALIGSWLLAYGSFVGLLYRYSRQIPKLSFTLATPAVYRDLASKYRDFPKYNAPTAFVMNATRQLPVFVLATFFGPEVVGFFGMADRIVRAPSNITAESVRTVFLQQIADMWNAGRPIRRATLHTTAVLGAMGLLPTVALWIWGQEVITLVLGDRWEVAGRFCEIMAPYLFARWMASPLQGVCIVTGQQREWFFLQLLAAGSRLLVIPIALFVTTAEGILSAYVWITVIAQIGIVVAVISTLHGRRPPPTEDAA